VHNGHVELVAIDCEYVENADDDDRVLVSCGVVLIHQSNGSDSPSCQVLLKRYLKSLPFIELLGFLSQFFRRLLHLKGPVKDSLEHLKRHTEKCVFWDQDELEAVSRLDIATAFQGNVVSFDSRWKQYLEEPLPEELKLLQAKASEELRRRKNNEPQLLADQKNRRWGLPKGNFRHRCLSGGIYIEPPHLCALRELKEETGLELSIAELLDAPSVQIDKPSVDGRPSIHQAMDMYCLRLIPPGWRHKEQDDGKGDSDSSGPPPVKGGSHEECCWLELGEARKVCAALDAVASSPEFDRLFQRT
jgi:8-oxo-dGTP pyrophosphatase MutT (NUDIX family)